MEAFSQLRSLLSDDSSLSGWQKSSQNSAKCHLPTHRCWHRCFTHNWASELLCLPIVYIFLFDLENPQTCQNTATTHICLELAYWMHETLMPMGGSMPDDNSYGQALSHVFFYFLQYTFSFTGIRSDWEHSYQTQKKKKKRHQKMAFIKTFLY